MSKNKLIFFKIPEQIFCQQGTHRTLFLLLGSKIYRWLIRFCFTDLKFGKFSLFWWIHHKGWEAGIPSFKDRYTNVSTNYLFFLQIFQVFLKCIYSSYLISVCFWIHFLLWIFAGSMRHKKDVWTILWPFKDLSLILQTVSKL